MLFSDENTFFLLGFDLALNEWGLGGSSLSPMGYKLLGLSSGILIQVKKPISKFLSHRRWNFVQL